MSALVYIGRSVKGHSVVDVEMHDCIREGRRVASSLAVVLIYAKPLCLLRNVCTHSINGLSILQQGLLYALGRLGERHRVRVLQVEFQALHAYGGLQESLIKYPYV